MAPNSRRRFLNLSDWHTLLNEERLRKPEERVDFYQLRRVVYHEIQEYRRRPLLIYGVQFPGNSGAPISIDLSDVDGFIDLVSSISDADSVDVLLHSPGGTADATERIVSVLRESFPEVHFLVPHSAYSAATMLALSGNSVTLHPSASLGPIDPQFDGIPARAIRRGFENAKDALKNEGPELLPAYVPLIEKYSLEMLELCEDAERLSKQLVREWLVQYMLKEDGTADQKADDAVAFFADYDQHLTHSRPLTHKKLQHLGLNIVTADKTLSSLIREAYILLSGFLEVSPFIKIYENSNGLSWGRQFHLASPPTQPSPDDKKHIGR